MKNTSKYTKIATGAIFISLLLGGCQARNPAFALDSFWSDDNGYCYNEAPWNISEQEFEDIHKVKLSELQRLESEDGSKVVYIDNEGLLYQNEDCLQSIEFIENQLRSVSFSFSSFEQVNPEEFFDQIVTDIENIYGAPTDFMENNAPLNNVDTTSLIYRWQSQKPDGLTSLQASMTISGNYYSILVGAGIF